MTTTTTNRISDESKATKPASNGKPQTQAQKDKALITKLRGEVKTLVAKLDATDNSMLIASDGKVTVSGQFLHERSKALGEIRDDYFAATDAKDASAFRKAGLLIWNQDLVRARFLASDGAVNDSNNTIGLVEFNVRDNTQGVIMSAKLFPPRMFA